MKVLFIGIDYFHYFNSFVSAGNSLGHEVEKIALRSFRETEPKWKIRLAKLGLTSLEKKYRISQNREIINKIQCFIPDICIFVGGHQVEAISLQTLKELKIKTVLFMCDSLQEENSKKLWKSLEYYDAIISYDSSDVEYFRNKYNVNYSFFGYDDKIFYPSIPEKKIFDICFIGLLDQKRLKYLEKVAEYAFNNKKNMVVYTPLVFTAHHFWKKQKMAKKKSMFESKYKYLSNFIQYRTVQFENLADIYRKTKICINLHRDEGIHTDVNPRTFEILGCQSFELIDKDHIKHTELKSDIHLVEFIDEFDLCNKIDFFLKNDQIRQEIENNGYQLVKERYTMEKCVENILNNY